MALFPSFFLFKAFVFVMLLSPRILLHPRVSLASGGERTRKNEQKRKEREKGRRAKPGRGVGTDIQRRSGFLHFSGFGGDLEGRGRSESGRRDEKVEAAFEEVAATESVAELKAHSVFSASSQTQRSQIAAREGNAKSVVFSRNAFQIVTESRVVRIVRARDLDFELILRSTAVET